MTREVGTRESKPERLDCPSIDEWILSILAGQEEQTLDGLGRWIPAVNWAQVFLAIDRLSCSGKIALWPLQHGDYRLIRKATR